MKLDEYEIIKNYKKVMMDILKYNFPTLGYTELEYAVDYIIHKNYNKRMGEVYNNYTSVDASSSLLDITEFIYNRQPILAANGCMFEQHQPGFTPFYNMLESFISRRAMYKKEMFKYDKGTELFNKYNMLQLLAKRDTNAIYGVAGNTTSSLYNLHVAVGITTTGKSLITHAICFFEQLFTNNIKCSSLDELITFIHRTLNESNVQNSTILDHDIDISDVFFKLLSSIDKSAINNPDMLDMIWSILLNLPQETLNRLYYKNNMYQFCNNFKVKNYICDIVKTLDKPFLDPNNPPEEIIGMLDRFYDVIKEWVYSSYIVFDKMNRVENLRRDISIITDTDSTIVSFDGWYQFVLDNILDNKEDIGLMRGIKQEELSYEEDVFDFATNEVVKVNKKKKMIVGEENVRFTIINILAYVISKLLRDHFDLYAKSTNTKTELKPCLISMKNEFLFKRVLLTSGKKNYASIQELQEGNIVPDERSLDIKGLPINKSTLKDSTKKTLQKILKDKVLLSNNVDPLDVIQHIAKLENDIYTSIKSGNKEYYKPSTIKSFNNYDDPYRIQGVKAAIVYNDIRDEGTEAIDLTIRNSVDIVKVNIDKKNIMPLKEKNKRVYDALVQILENDKFKGEITAVSLPLDADIPEWLLDYVDYGNIINDNIKNFPLESIGISRFDRDSVNYTNVIQF